MRRGGATSAPPWWTRDAATATAAGSAPLFPFYFPSLCARARARTLPSCAHALGFRSGAALSLARARALPLPGPFIPSSSSSSSLSSSPSLFFPSPRARARTRARSPLTRAFLLPLAPRAPARARARPQSSSSSCGAPPSCLLPLPPAWSLPSCCIPTQNGRDDPLPSPVIVEKSEGE